MDNFEDKVSTALKNIIDVWHHIDKLKGVKVLLNDQISCSNLGNEEHDIDKKAT